MDSYLIYEVVNPVNGKRYIGKTGDLEMRKRDHKCLAANGTDRVFYRAIRKYGFEIFQWNTLSTHTVEADALEAEVQVIAQLRAEGVTLYNMTSGGDGTSGFKHTPEQCAANTARQLGRKATDEARKNQSAAQIGGKRSAETKERMSKAAMGREKGDTARARMSASKNKSSQYQGVGYNKARQFWFSRIWKDGKSHWIGSFNTELAAHNAYEQFTITG